MYTTASTLQNYWHCFISTKKKKGSIIFVQFIQNTYKKYRNSHCGDKTISPLSYLHNGITHHKTAFLNFESSPSCIFQHKHGATRADITSKNKLLCCRWKLNQFVSRHLAACGQLHCWKSSMFRDSQGSNYQMLLINICGISLDIYISRYIYISRWATM